MADANLVDFVEAALERGETRSRIKEVLKAAGWPDDQVDSALGAFAEIEFALPVPLPRGKTTGSAREAFLLIVYFSLLGMIAGQVGGLSFAWIDRAFADKLADQYAYYEYATSGLRWSVASLLVGYPIFLFIGSRLSARRRRDLERRRSRVRAWLTYVTLIFAAVALIGDLVAIVYQFLSGGLGARFVLKALVVGVIAGAILINYSRSAEREETGGDWIGPVLMLAATIAVALLVAWAFTITRGPTDARKRQADELRIQNLGAIARLVDCHYTYFGELPDSLASLAGSMPDYASRQPVAAECGESVATDPTTYADYLYLKGTGASYRLCAVFERGWPDITEEMKDQRRYFLNTYAVGRLTGSERRTLIRPGAAGETCFDIDAVKFKTETETETETPSSPQNEPAGTAPE